MQYWIVLTLQYQLGVVWNSPVLYDTSDEFYGRYHDLVRGKLFNITSKKCLNTNRCGCTLAKHNTKYKHKKYDLSLEFAFSFHKRTLFYSEMQSGMTLQQETTTFGSVGSIF